MATRCGHSSKGDPDNLCDRCEEHARQIHRELYGYCRTHCGQTTLAGAFEQHKWNVYHREGYHPRGRRVRM